MKITDKNYPTKQVLALELTGTTRGGANKPLYITALNQVTGNTEDYVLKYRGAERMDERTSARESVSFDLKKTGDIKDKIYRWAGIIGELQTAEEPLNLYLLSLMPNDAHLQHFIEQKLTIQQPNLKVRIVKEQDALKLVQEIKLALELVNI